MFDEDCYLQYKGVKMGSSQEIGLGLRGGVVGVRGFLGGVEGARCRFSYRGRGS